MNKDLIIGILASLAVHSGIFLFSRKAPPPVRVAPPKEEVVQLEMPPLDEEKDETVKDLEDQPQENVLAPPSLVDVPTVVPVEAFTQPLAPPPPPGLTASRNAIAIPVVRPGANFGSGIKDLFDINNLDQRPILQVPVQPEYPYEMKRAGVSGQVTVMFIIDTNGNVIDVRVDKSTHREFELPALKAVAKWKFKPGRKGGRAVNTKVSQPVEFNLNEN